jgi:hypothetical protein
MAGSPLSILWTSKLSEGGLILEKALDFQQKQRPASYLPVSGYMLGSGLALQSRQSVLRAERLQMGLGGCHGALLTTAAASC